LFVICGNQPSFRYFLLKIHRRAINVFGKLRIYSLEIHFLHAFTLAESTCSEKDLICSLSRDFFRAKQI